MDIIVHKQFKTVNSWYANILLVVDCFSKMLYLEKLKTRKDSDVIKALGSILKRSKGTPEKIGADREGSFRSRALAQFLAKKGITLYHPVSYLHASLSERYVGRVKRVIARLFTLNGNHKWLGFEQDIANQINHSYNRAIKMRPVDVNKKNESQVWYNLYSKFIQTEPVKPRFRIGDLVKISTRTLKDVFQKSYDVGWSLETYKVASVRVIGSVPYYTLQDLHGNGIEGTFYNENLQLVGREENSDD